MANDFYFNPIERVAVIADSCGMQIMSSTRMPYDTASPHTCWKPVLICVLSRFYLAIPRSAILHSTCICPAAICKRFQVRWKLSKSPALAG